MLNGIQQTTVDWYLLTYLIDDFTDTLLNTHSRSGFTHCLEQSAR